MNCTIRKKKEKLPVRFKYLEMSKANKPSWEKHGAKRN